MLRLIRDSGLWSLTLSPLLSAIHFVVCYASTGMYCARTDGVQGFTDIRLGLAAMTVTVLMLISWLTWRAWKRWGYGENRVYEQGSDSQESRTRFLGHTAFLLGALSWVGVAFITTPVILVGSCL